MAKIYAICDKNLLDSFSLSLEEYIKIAKYFNVEWIQYRDKKSTIEEKRENILFLKKLWQKPLIVNDFIELAQFADGVHLGQEDILDFINSFDLKSKYEAIKEIRKIVGKKIIGVSTHDENEIREANILDIDYIGLGSFRKTNTKDVKSYLSSDFSKLIALSKHPVAIIGGVRVYDDIDVDFKAIGKDLIIKGITYN